jgi:hypothetical protein
VYEVESQVLRSAVGELVACVSQIEGAAYIPPEELTQETIDDWHDRLTQSLSGVRAKVFAVEKQFKVQR